MNFLKEEFLDQLRAEVDQDTGKVIIEAAEFTPQQILQEVSEITFTEAFDEWTLNRKEENLEKADEILNLHSNRNRFGALKTRFVNGAILPFVGAGMSMTCGYSGWTNYLEKIIEESNADKEAFTQLILEYKYEEAAQLIFDSMGAARFNEELENEFGQHLTITGAVRFLPYLFKNGVITTNFDDVLKRCFDSAESPFDDTLLGQEAEELQRHLGEEKKVLIKLHGKASSARNRVLTLDEYNQHYNDAQVLERCIKAITSKTILFLGCSLATDRTIQKMKEIILAEGHDCMPRHYAFLKKGVDRIARSQELAEANIYPIWYEGDHDQCIEALFEKLKEGVNI